MKLIHKFFFAFFVTNTCLVGLLFLFIYISFISDFDDFVKQAEQAHVARVKQQLFAVYDPVTHWDNIAKNQDLWHAIVEPERDMGVALPSASLPAKTAQKDKNTDWEPATLEGFNTGRRISLYDQNKQVIIGKPDYYASPYHEAISANGNVIGWLTLDPAGPSSHTPATLFLASQLKRYTLIALVVIVLAFFMALLLSQQLTKPIKRIILAVNNVTKGNFDRPVKIKNGGELGLLSDNINQLAGVLKQNQTMRQQWISDTSHELRTPLTVLRSQLIAVKDGVLIMNDKRLDLLLDEVAGLQGIVDDLAQLAYTDNAHLTYAFEKLDITRILLQTMDTFSPRLAQASLQAHMAIPEHEVWVRGDKHRLTQLFGNLMENACRYTHAGGEVLLRAEVTSTGQVVLYLQDSAPGVAEDELSLLVKRFYRVEKSRNRATGGAGLGLALCQQIIEAHQGSIGLSSSSLGGLEVKIVLPLIK